MPKAYGGPSHVFIGSFEYELPFGPGKPLLTGKGTGGFLFGGWQINGILSLHSGFVTDIRTSRVPAGNQLFATILD